MEHKPSPEQGWVGNETPAWCPSPVCPLPPPPGIGYASQMIVTLLNIYYIIVLAWALFYLFSSFTVDLPWGSCRHDWNTGEVTPSCLASVTGERDRPHTLGPRPPPLTWDALEVFQGHHRGLTPKIRARIHQHHRENVTELFSKSNFTYLFLLVLGLCCCTCFPLFVGRRGVLWFWCLGFSLRRLLLLGSTGSRHTLQWPQHVGTVVSAPGLWSTGSVVVTHRLSCSLARRIIPTQGSNPRSTEPPEKPYRLCKKFMGSIKHIINASIVKTELTSFCAV